MDRKGQTLRSQSGWKVVWLLADNLGDDINIEVCLESIPESKN